MNRQTKSRLEVAAIYLFLAVTIVIIVYPLLWTIGLSLNPGTSLYGANMIPETGRFVTMNGCFLIRVAIIYFGIKIR